MVHGEKLDGIDDDLPDAYLFKLEMVPNWSKNIVSLLTIGNIHNQPPQKVEETRLYSMLAGRLYKYKQDNVLSLCIEPKDQYLYIQYAHIVVGNVHFSKKQRLREIKYFGVYWPPQMRADVHKWVSSCERYKQNPPIPYATLFQVQINPKWGQHILNYLQKRKIQETMNKQRRRALEIEAMDFTIISQQLYKIGKDL